MTAYTGVRIADFSEGVAGPMAAMLLGDFDAEVVKVEPPGGDRAKDHPGYLAFNRNKQVVSLDLTAADGVAAARALIAGADVAIFDHAPGRLEALGLDAASLTAAHPALVHAWMPPYGTERRLEPAAGAPQPARRADRDGVRQGSFSDQPIHLILPVLHYAPGGDGLGRDRLGAFRAARSGRGQAVTISGLHGASESSGRGADDGADPIPRGTPPGSNPRYRLYQCAGRGVVLPGHAVHQLLPQGLRGAGAGGRVRGA
jgi:crotonobetainyl-CoA:carnitine CoA-transferase CaiB-like acyl-CoA transferase